jgi:hypothetical protein
VSHLRRLLAGKLGGDPTAYVVERHDRLHLTLAADAGVDLWRVREHMFRAACALDRPTKVAELSMACALCRGRLADGGEYAWIAPHREVVRRQILDAHRTLAELVADSDPGEAARLRHVADGFAA